jgi:alcohol dehydrogenase (NADP+)
MPNEDHVGVLLAISMTMSACSWLMAVVVAVVVALVAATTTSAVVAVVGAFVGWVSTTWLPEGFVFASIIPLTAGMPPPPLWGPWETPLTPAVPDWLKPQPRPSGEMFLTLPGGGQMPANGLGMCCRPSAYDEETVRRSVLWYLLQGGRHIDTAQLNLNHKPIGAAITQAIERGVPRAEIWVTTKLHERFYDRGEETILGMVQEWLKELQVEYLDLALLHRPKPMIPLFVHKCTNWTQCTASAWRALAKAKTKGYVRNIGVSNFDIDQLKEVQALGAAPIAVNQFMLNPFSPAWAFDIASFCKENGIAGVYPHTHTHAHTHAHTHTHTHTHTHICSYGFGGAGGDDEHEGAHSQKVLSTVILHRKSTSSLTFANVEQKAVSEEVVQGIAFNNSISPAQVLLRWALQKGYSVIPGSGNPEHQKENLAIYSVTLTGEEMTKIDMLRDNPHYTHDMAPQSPMNGKIMWERMFSSQSPRSTGEL